MNLEDPFTFGYSVSYDPSASVTTTWPWDFGDGKRVKASQVEHAYEQPGEYSITLAVTDCLGQESSAVFKVEVR